MRICSSVTDGASLASFASACRTRGSAVISAAEERLDRTALRESTPIAESITQSRLQVTIGPPASFTMRIGLVAELDMSLSEKIRQSLS